MLRAATRKLINEILEESYFGSANFLVSYRDGNPTILNIEFLPNRGFSFALTLPETKGTTFICKEAPGIDFLTRASFLVRTIDEFIRRLHDWLDRLREETINVNPVARELEELKADLEVRLAEISEERDEFFSAAEANELASHLQNLQDRLAQLEVRSEEDRHNIDRLEKIVQELTDAASQVNKATWYRMAGGKLLTGIKFLARSKEFRSIALEATRRIVLPAPEEK